MSMQENKELYIKMLHEVLIEELQNDTGGQEEAIKNVCYCMALWHLFSLLCWNASHLSNFSIWLNPIFQSTALPYKMLS